MAQVARGAGVLLFAVKIKAAPALVTIECERRPADGGDDTGGHDSGGLDLHLLYEGVRGPLGDHSDDAVRFTSYEFDAMPEVVVPRCGELKLIGGAGLWRVSMSQPEPWPHAYQQQWRQLSRHLVRDSEFRVPRGHTMIGAHNASSIVAVDGALLELDGSAKAIASGSVVRAVTASLRLFTAVFF